MTTMGVHGQGSVTKRKTGPPYQVSIAINGRRVYRYAHSAREAKKVRRELVEMRETDRDPTRLTVADFLRSWIQGLRDAKNQRIRPRTLDHYALITERHIIPALGHHRLSALREAHIQHWLDSDEGAPRTVHHHRAVLRRALNVAIRYRLIGHNPSLGVDLPPARWEGSKPLTVEEANAVLQATKGDRLHALWRLAMISGLRQAELLGLPWEAVDLDAGSLTVTSQLQRIGGAWVRTPTKAHRSLATISIGAVTVEALSDHRVRMAGERTPEWRYFGLVFTTPKGEPITNHEVLRQWHKACEKAGIERRRFHDLRHGNASVLRELDVPEDVRMARMGHSTVTQSRRYGKASEAQDRAAADALDRALAG